MRGGSSTSTAKDKVIETKVRLKKSQELNQKIIAQFDETFSRSL